MPKTFSHNCGKKIFVTKKNKAYPAVKISNSHLPNEKCSLFFKRLICTTIEISEITKYIHASISGSV